MQLCLAGSVLAVRALCVPRAGRALSFTARMCAAGHAGAVLLSSAVVSGN